MKSKEFQEKSTVEYEAKIREHLSLKLNLLKKERAIKMKADFTPMEPQYEYEKTAEWKDYLREVALHNIFQNEIAIDKQEKDLELKVLERAELEEMRNGN